MAKVFTNVVVFVELVGVGEVGSMRGGGSVDDDPAEEDDDFEAELEAVDVVVSVALAVVSLGSKALVSDSILAQRRSGKSSTGIALLEGG
jgi:hypothetical protein